MAGETFDREKKLLVWHRDEGRCWRCGVAVWEGDVHHRRPRQQGGGWAVWEWINHHANLLLLCRGCHNWVEAEPELARAAGYRLDLDGGVPPAPDNVLVHCWDGLWYRLHGEDFRTPMSGLLAPFAGSPAPRWSVVG